MSATSRFFLWSILFTLLSCWTVKPETSQPAIENDDIPYNLEKGNCADRPYKTHLFSEDPLVIYIESFVSTDEASQLVALSEKHFKASRMWSGDGGSVADSTYRSSTTASLPREAIVRCMEERARSFPAWDSLGFFMPLLVQRYGISNQYKDHYDWFPGFPDIEGNHESTFFVYIQANCTGGGTNFPLLRAPEDEKWCDFIDCDQPYDAGVAFKPITGNAIFWRNLHPDGRGHKKTLHAGLPVTSGMKTGLNIFTWVDYNKPKSEL